MSFFDDDVAIGARPGDGTGADLPTQQIPVVRLPAGPTQSGRHSVRGDGWASQARQHAAPTHTAVPPRRSTPAGPPSRRPGPVPVPAGTPRPGGRAGSSRAASAASPHPARHRTSNLHTADPSAIPLATPPSQAGWPTTGSGATSHGAATATSVVPSTVILDAETATHVIPRATDHGAAGYGTEVDVITPRRGARRRAGGRRRRTRSLLWRISTTAATFTTLLVLAAAGLTGYEYQKLNHQLKRVSVLQTHDPHIRNPARQQNAANFLVIGSDTRAGADAKFGNTAGARSDTTILVHLSPDRSRATIISIPRDSWVDIPDCKGSDGTTVAAHSEMFNSAFAVGGATCTIATVQKLTGIVVTHFVEIDFSGFESMVKALGTVTICSPQDVSDKGSGLRLRAGQNHLGGAQALAFVRARESIGDGSDLGRIKRQQIFLGAVLRQAMTGPMLSNPARLASFLDAATKAITIDRGTTFGDLRTLATSMRGLDPRHVTFYTAPIANQNYTPPGTSMTGRVLLDGVQGRALYDSVINDTKPVFVRTVAGKSRVQASSPATPGHPSRAPTTPAAGASTAPKPGLNAGQQTCSL